MAAHMTSDHRVNVGVFTPYLQGHFFGELVTQLYQYCLLKNYRFSLIKTDGFGAYDSLVHTDHLDFCVILRNAVHPSLLENLLAHGKSVVSIAFDYFPLQVPMIGCDNELGVELAINHLIKNGHRRFAFVGDISNYDIRRRYEAFCDQLEINEFEVVEDDIFIAKNELFIGGHKAANDFIKNQCEATGILCGSGLTGIGFGRQYRSVLPHKRDDLDIICFDALSLVPIAEPDLAVVDQNLHLLAYKALQVFDDIKKGKEVPRVNLIEPKLISNESDLCDADQLYLATSTDVSELMNPNYIKGLMDSLYEWPKIIVDGNLDDVMMLAVLFPRHLSKACFARVASGKEGQSFIKITKIMGSLGAEKTSATDMKTISSLAAYPSVNSDINWSKMDSVFHIPIYKEGSLWAVISFFGVYTSTSEPSMLRGFFAYLDQVLTIFQASINVGARSQVTKESTSTVASHEHVSGTIEWDMNERHLDWDDAALRLVGIESDLEKNIYRHMELVDCVHSDHMQLLQESLSTISDKGFSIDITLRHRDKSFRQYHLLTEPAEKAGFYLIHITALDVTI